MGNLNIDDFGAWLVGRVRENACALLREYTQGGSTDRISRLFRDLYSRHAVFDPIVAEAAGLIAMDLLIDSLLTALDHDPNIGLIFTRGNSQSLNLKNASDGLAGELYGNNGWFAKYATTPSQLT